MPTENPQNNEDHMDGSSNRTIDPDCVVSGHQEFCTWSRGQEEAYHQLVEVADAFFEMDWGATGLRPRLDSLIVGPSGTGKSHIVRMVSQKLGIPRLRLSFSEWIPMGARERPSTMHRLHGFISENSRGLIHIDEIDKFRVSNTGEWSTSIFTELFLLLDRSVEHPSRFSFAVRNIWSSVRYLLFEQDQYYETHPSRSG
jgi:SpoVK/Ycf46/Vps4 family AAA+-type ATPase